MLRRHFGMGWYQAMEVEPAWYVDLLLDGLRAETAVDDVGGEPEQAAPDTLEEWR